MQGNITASQCRLCFEDLITTIAQRTFARNAGYGGDTDAGEGEALGALWREHWYKTESVCAGEGPKDLGLHALVQVHPQRQCQSSLAPGFVDAECVNLGSEINIVVF